MWERPAHTSRDDDREDDVPEGTELLQLSVRYRVVDLALGCFIVLLLPGKKICLKVEMLWAFIGDFRSALVRLRGLSLSTTG